MLLTAFCYRVIMRALNKPPHLAQWRHQFRVSEIGETIKEDCFPSQTLRIMQLTTVFFLAFALTVSARINSQTITFTGKNIPLQQVLAEVGTQTGFGFVISDKQVQEARPVSISAKEIPLDEFLQLIFDNQPFDYIIRNKNIFIRNKHRTAKPTLLLDVPPITVKGRIVNENGEPVIASVIVKGTNRGTTSDVNGEFELENVDENAELIITSANTEETTVKINNRTSIIISVKSAVSDLDAVVINKGYYAESKRLTTGNVAKVGSKDIAKQPVSNPLQAIQGRMAGVYVEQTSGVPGGKFNIQIRGRNSLRPEGNFALYVVDGVPFPSQPFETGLSASITAGGSPLSNLNISDIESIEILKDADATAIYGSRGANGVVLITTKKGRPGQSKVDVNIYSGIGKVKKMELLSTRQYLDMRYEAFQNDGVSPQPWDYDITTWDTTRYTDWQNELIGGTANITSVQTSLSWGNINNQFLVGGTYYKETTVFPGDLNDKKSSFHFSINHTSENKKLRALFSGNYVNDVNDLNASDLTSTALTLSPNAPKIFRENGDLNWENSTWLNPFASLKRKYKSRSNNLIGNSKISYEIMPGLLVLANMGYTNQIIDEINTLPSSAFNPVFNFSPRSSFSNIAASTWLVEPQIEYKVKIGPGRFTFLIGSTFQQSNKRMDVIDGTGYTSDELLESIRGASVISAYSAENSLYRYNALFGRINYNIADKYVLNLTGRRDGSTRFGPGKKLANFGAIGIGWVFTNENFIRNNINWLTLGKIRASYGITGSDQIADYGYLDLWKPTFASYAGVRGFYANNLFNPDYGWESNKKLEIGLDLGLLHDRIQLSISYYRNRSSNQLVGFPLSTVTGFFSIQSNLPALVQNTGTELEIHATVLQKQHFSWTSNLNVTIPRSKLIAFENLENFPGYSARYVVGKPVEIVQAYHYIGVDPLTGLITFQDLDGNGSGRDVPADLQALKSTGQTLFGGFQNTFSYKKFQVDILTQFVKQNGTNPLFQNSATPGMAYNQPAFVMDRWTKPGDDTNIQKFTQSYGSEATLAYSAGQGDNRIADASFVRIKNVSLSYNIDPKALSAGLIKSIRVFAQGQNLFTFTKYKGLDPESQSYSLPPLRVISIGANVSF